MVAASFWSLLQPAIELAEKSGYYGPNGQFSFIPVGVGFSLGAAFVGVTDMIMSRMVRRILKYSIVSMIKASLYIIYALIDVSRNK